VPRDDQLEQAVDILRELKLAGIVTGVPNLQNTITMAHQFPKELGTFVGMEGPASEEDLDTLADRTGIGRWGVRTAVWGDRVVVDHHVQRIRDAWSAIEGSRVDLTQVYTDDNWDEMSTFIEKVQAGIPSIDLMDVVPENLGHIGFSPVVPLKGSEVRYVADRIKDLVTTEAGSNFVCAIFPTNDRSCFIVSSVYFDRTNREQWAASFATVKKLVRELGAEGYGEYRAHLDFMDLAAEQHRFGDHAYRRFTRAIKDAVDPNGILSPGRHGVWPAKYLEDGDR
jgi:4-cresol dehydrogenase (hydroxylating)